ncbi:Crp/Fnr family transcriptional regulator [Devosia chinhatensis]|uniref:Crp/Fnr family transcriptional regulator n=1 Tax=Devosia chinhatensis TaxID=429727 RepID=UPI000AC44501|nr:Crp/Fnr family transcriptional regulator [Devosia chinhatensis]
MDRFILRMSAYEALDSGARDALYRAVKTLAPVPACEMQREHGAELCILLTGWVCHFKLLGNGRRQITSVILPGDLVDFSFLTSRTSNLQFRTTTTSQFGHIGAAQFAAAAEEFPALMKSALRALAIETAIREERVMSLGVRTAMERLSHFLCEIWRRLDVVGLVNADHSFELPMTQSDIGEALGLSTVHVNRTIQALRRDGAITLRGGRVTLQNPARLISLSGFDPAYLGIEAVGPINAR